MTDEPALNQHKNEPQWVTRLAAKRPDVVFMAPFMIYLLLLGLNDLVPEAWMPIAIAIRGIGGLAVFWLFRKHYPPLGKPFWGTAIVAGILVAAGWVAGQHLANQVTFGEHSLGGRFFLFPGKNTADYPFEGLGPLSMYSQIVLRILVATTTVAIVEELFWRGFLLRALINWDRFEKIPLGTFTWLSFLGTSLLSMFEHPDNWLVSIFCWFAFNGLMYWRKSLLCLMLTHGITNLVLYTYVLIAGDWLFW